MVRIFRDSKTRLDGRLRAELGAESVELCAVHAKRLPGYRYVDAYRAMEGQVAKRAERRHLDAYSPETLLSLLHSDQSWAPRRIICAERHPFQVNAD